MSRQEKLRPWASLYGYTTWSSGNTAFLTGPDRKLLSVTHVPNTPEASMRLSKAFAKVMLHHKKWVEEGEDEHRTRG